MRTRTLLAIPVALGLAVAPVAAQENQPAPGDTAAAEAPAAPGDTAAMAAPTYDWEFSLAPTGEAPGASGTVQVTEGDDGNSFTVVTRDLPVVDSLDQEGRDVNAYTVWVVPSKEKVSESTLAGVLTIDPASGEGRLESTTGLPTFGVIVTATPDGAPDHVSGVPVLTGIPVQQAAAPADTTAPEETAAPADSTPAPPAEPPAPADTTGR